MSTPSPFQDNPILPGFSVIHANHLEDLRSLAVQWIKNHPTAPLENECFLVQSNGMAQWLKLALGSDGGCGIATALDIQLPGRFVWQAYRSVLPGTRIPEHSPFDRDELLWRIFRLMPSLMADGRFDSLRRFLDTDAGQRRRYQLAGMLANLFDQYQVYRADWLELWLAGDDAITTARGKTRPLQRDQAWQPELWRKLQEAISSDGTDMSRAGLHRLFLERAKQLTKRPEGIPRRIMVFGISSLPAQVLEVLKAISPVSQIMIFVHNPCRHFWADIIEDRELLAFEQSRHKPKRNPSSSLTTGELHQQVNPLLAAWGKQGRDYIGMLYGHDEPESYKERFLEIDLFENVVAEGSCGTLLQEVQQAILDLTPAPEHENDRKTVAEDDRSLTFHVAHSRQREMEILQDRLLHLFETVPDLKPGDIMVMTPDINHYAPHVQAVFGTIPSRDSRYIPFTIADSPQRAQIPMLVALETLLNLPDSRLTVSDLLGLLDVPAFRSRFGIAEQDLPKLKDWIQGTKIAWGMDGAHRSRFGMAPEFFQNTWIFGLQRMLLGYAVGHGDPWKGIEPFGDIGGLTAALAGCLSQVLTAIASLTESLTAPAQPEIWFNRIQTMIRDVFLPEERRERLFLNRLADVLDTWFEACTSTGLDVDLSREVVRDTLMAGMTESSISQRFLAGRVNFGTLMPMRAIPFTVVCLLGMNDADYPRVTPPMDFDLMADPGLYRPGDRSRRDDDRYLFLEALLSARHTLHISYVGKDIRDNSPRMPSVLVGQLREYLARGWKPASGEALLPSLTSDYPLQPFSSRYVDGSDPSRIFTYAREWYRETEPLRDRHTGFLPEPAGPEDALKINTLVRFFKNPVNAFFLQRFNIRFDDVSLAVPDRETFALDRLAPFGPGLELLEAGRDAPSDTCLKSMMEKAHRLKAEGRFPMAGFGDLAVRRLTEPVAAMLDYHNTLQHQWPLDAAPVDLSVSLALPPSGPGVLEDRLSRLNRAPDPDAGYCQWQFYPNGIHDANMRVIRPWALADLWIRHLAGSAAGMILTSCLVAPDGVATLPVLDPDTAVGHLETLVSTWWEGLSHPLPVTAKTACTFLLSLAAEPREAAKEPERDKALTLAAKAYQGDDYTPGGELRYTPALQRIYPDFTSLVQEGDARFFDLADVLYLPLISHLAGGW